MPPPSFAALNAHPRVHALARALWSRVTVFALAALYLERTIYRGVVAAAGGPSEPLDDSFIHFQYARSIATFHPFRYGSPLDAPSSGETSPAYGFALAVLYLVGFRVLRLVIGAHLLGAVGWTLTAEGMYRIGERAWGTTVAWGCALMAFASAGLVWAAGSGMETIFAVAITVWIFATLFALDEERTHRQSVTLAVLSALAPFVRPELVALSALGVFAIAVRGTGRDRWLALVALSAFVLPPLFWRMVIGSWRTTGAITKLILYDPYLTRREMLVAIGSNAGRMVTDVLAGNGWAVRYFPSGANKLAAAGFVVVFARALARRRFVSAVGWFGGVLFILVPAACSAWDVHRYRYLWEVFALPMVCMVVLCAAAGALVERGLARFGTTGVRGLCSAGAVGALLALFAWRVPDAIDDLADCGRSIHEQQVTLAGDLRRLPRDTSVLINDAGALAYLGEHRTVDFVGLTTQELAEPYANGRGSTFEALEAMPPSRRPQFAALYRAWFQNDTLLGPTLLARTVQRSSILGGGSMELAPVRAALFDTGTLPFDPLAPGERIVDEMDTALLPSEHAHDYQNEGDHHDDDIVFWAGVPTRGVVMEGARAVRQRETLRLRALPSHPTRVIVRVGTWGRTVMALRWNGALLDPHRALGTASGLADLSFVVPRDLVRSENQVEAIDVDHFGFASCHYYVVSRGP